MMENQWYAILPSKAVRKNRILAVRRLNLDLALFRDSTGKAACLVDQCTHRGAALSVGKHKGNCIRCPFHALEFNREGKCVFIPANGKASTEDLSRYNVRSYPVSETNGILYIWYGEESKATGEPSFFHDFIDETWTYSELTDHWNAHYSRVIENQLDVVHVPIVHYNTIGRGNKTLVNGPKVLFENGMIRTSANNEVDAGQTPKKAEDCVMKPTWLGFMFPNIWLNHISEKILVIIYFAPVDDENTILYIRFYCKITGVKAIDSLIAAVGKIMNKTIERQDKRVVVTQKPKASAFKSAEKLVAGDGPIILYRKMRDELMYKLP